MISPGNDSEEARLQALWYQAREFERRTFSNVSVTGSSGVKLLEVTPLPDDPSRTQVVVRDHASGELLKNDTNAGWGLASPVNGYPAYGTQPTTNGFETTFTERWLFAGYVFSPNVEWSYIHGVDDAAVTSECRIEYCASSLSGPWVTVTGSTAQSTWLATSGTPPTSAAGQLTLPLSASGQFYGIRLMQRRIGGSGFERTYCSPVYLNSF